MFDGGLNSRNINPPLMQCTDVPQFTALQMAASRFRKDPKLHLKHLLGDAFRCQGLIAVHKTSPEFENRLASSIDTQQQQQSTDALPLLLRRENSGAFASAAATTGSGDNSGDASDAIPRWSNNSDKPRIILDYSRQHVTGETMELLFDLADRMGLTERMSEMRSGMNINYTERRAVMHHVLRMPRGYDFKARHPQGDAILKEVHSTLGKYGDFLVVSCDSST